MRSSKDNLALRALVTRPPAPPTPAAELRALLAHPNLRPVSYRLARTALESGNAAAIAEELVMMRREVARATDSKNMLARLFPQLPL